jgi:hypothetical protein
MFGRHSSVRKNKGTLCLSSGGKYSFLRLITFSRGHRYRVGQQLVLVSLAETHTEEPIDQYGQRQKCWYGQEYGTAQEGRENLLLTRIVDSRARILLGRRMGKHASVGDRSGGRGGNPDPTDFDRTASLAGEYSPDPLYVYCMKMLSRPTAKCSRPLRVTTFMFAARTLTPLLSSYVSTKESPCPGGENADQTPSALRS